MSAVSHDPDPTVGTVIVPLDGSAFAERALGPATALARAFGARLELLHVTDDEEHGREYLARTAGSLVADDVAFGVHSSTPRHALLERVEGAQAPLVCLASHAHSGVGAAVLGNLADHLLGASSAPTVLVGPAVDPDQGHWPAAGQRHLVVAYDGSDTATAMVPWAVACARAFGWDLHLAMVLHRHGSFLGDHDATRPRQVAENLVAALVAEGVEAQLDLLDGLEPGHALCELAETLPAGLVVVASHRDRSPVRALLGSTATRIAHHAPCPVLVRRPA